MNNNNKIQKNKRKKTKNSILHVIFIFVQFKRNLIHKTTWQEVFLIIHSTPFNSLPSFLLSLLISPCTMQPIAFGWLCGDHIVNVSLHRNMINAFHCFSQAKGMVYYNSHLSCIKIIYHKNIILHLYKMMMFLVHQMHNLYELASSPFLSYTCKNLASYSPFLAF